MAVEKFGNGGMVITGEHIDMYRLLVLKSALKLEMLGIKHSAGSVYAIVKKEFGFKGNKQKVLEQLEAYIKEKEVPNDSKKISATE